ncbi:MAG: hypothetical protein ACR2OE_13380 [Thermomicrobiales bacterium]
MKEFQTVPFNPVIKEKQATKEGADAVAKQMQEQISRASKAGWMFTSYETVQVTINHGCLAALAGRGSSLVTYGVLISSETQLRDERRVRMVAAHVNYRIKRLCLGA